VISPALVQDASARALASGALQPIETIATLLDDAGVRFVVRAVSSLARKEAARLAPVVADPLGDFEPDLFVADLGPSHYVLLNKFNVVDGHLLVVTRRFEAQESLLGLEDFEALAACLAEVGGLGFYNGGVEAGASQPRKHLQVVPLPLAPGTADDVPMERALESGPRLPFRHAFARLAPSDGAREWHACYRELLARAGIPAVATARGECHSAPYNLLVRPGWMFVVPRSAASFESIPVNALGFAGSLFVRSPAHLERVRAVGPMQVLRAVGFQAQ
jgi:ATP adenylyltransferase